jgi:hypothetical protein
MGLILEVQSVFLFLSGLYYMLPIAIQLLIMGVFGTFLLLGLFQAVKG